MPQILYAIETVFRIWMLVDCAQRGGGFYWYLIMWVPLGPLAYFFTVKIHDYDLPRLKRFLRFERPPSVEALRYRLRETATPANKLALAQALVDAKQAPAEAAELFREVLRWEANDKRAQYGLGLALVQTGDVPGALDVLGRLVQQDPNFHDYDAWREVAELRWKSGAREAAVEDLEGLSQQTHRVDHRLALAQRLVELDRKDEARKLLESTVEAYKHSPRYIQRRDARARRGARALLKTL